MEICGPLWGMTFYLMKLLRRCRRSNPMKTGRVCATRRRLCPASCRNPHLPCVAPPIANHAEPKPVFVRGRAAWQMGNSSRACQAAGGWQFLKPPGTPMALARGSLLSTFYMGGWQVRRAGPAPRSGQQCAITGIVVFDIWRAVDILCLTAGPPWEFPLLSTELY